MNRSVFWATMALLIAAVPWIASLVHAEPQNQLTPEEQQAGFQLLFNGRNLEGWKQAGNWTVQDGSLCREKSGGGITFGRFPIPDDFELCFQWKVASGSNSGVYYRPGQYEYQILDNQQHPDGKNPRTSAASIYFCMAPSHDATEPVGQWNDGRIVCKGTVIQHWLNGAKVIDFDYANEKWAGNVDLLKKRGANLDARGAFLHLQDHGDPVCYRAIKLRTLTADDRLDRSPVEPAEIPAAALQAEQEKLERILKNRAKKEG